MTESLDDLDDLELGKRVRHAAGALGAFRYDFPDDAYFRIVGALVRHPLPPAEPDWLEEEPTH